MEEQFRIVDLNKDGFIDAEELKKVMKNLGMKHSDEEISLMLQYADINGERESRQFDLISFRFTFFFFFCVYKYNMFATYTSIIQVAVR